MEQFLNKKANTEDLISISKKVDDAFNNILDKEKFDTNAKQVRHALEEVSKDMAMKSNIKDVCKLLDLKANIKYVENVLGSYREDISKRVKSIEYEDDKSKQGYILDVLIQETCIGRWVWKSGELKNNYAIPWELQAANTNPDNYLWEKEKTSVLVVQPGLYEISLGF